MGSKLRYFIGSAERIPCGRMVKARCKQAALRHPGLDRGSTNNLFFLEI